MLVGHVAEIGTARALEDIAAETRHVSDLLAGGKLQRLRDSGVIMLDVDVIGCIRHTYERAKP